MVEFASDEVEVVLISLTEIGALREILPEEPVRVLICASLPGRVWIGEEDPPAGLGPDSCVVEHLVSLIPGQRAPQLRWQLGERTDERVAYRPRGVVTRKTHEHSHAGLALWPNAPALSP